MDVVQPLVPIQYKRNAMQLVVRYVRSPSLDPGAGKARELESLRDKENNPGDSSSCENSELSVEAHANPHTWSLPFHRHLVVVCEMALAPSQSTGAR